MLHLINWEAIRTKRSRHLILDLVMLVLALVHLMLLLFDATYFQLRPYYLSYVPGLSQSYDLLKGVEPHRDTVYFEQQATAFFAACRSEQASAQSQPVGQASAPPAQAGQPLTNQPLASQPEISQPGVSQKLLQNQQELTRLSDTLIEEDPFARAGLSGRLEQIKADIRNFTGVSDSSKQAFRAFWGQGCQDLERREVFFKQEIAPKLQLNFWRQLGTNGRYIDHFLYVDLVFISIFLLEFLFSWRLAVRRLGREQRILYPLYHWYDLVSCIPLQQLRMLRLLRILALYYRLVRSDIITIRNSRIYQSVLKYQAIVMEEISDRVAINILTNIQAKTRLGGSRDLMEDTLRANRDEIRNVIVANLQRIDLPTLQLRQEDLTDTVAKLVMQSIEATDEYQRLSALPLVSGLVANLINEGRIARMSEQAMDAFLEAWQEQLRSEAMQSLLCELVDDVLDQVLSLSLDQRIQRLIQDISVKILEELKEISTTSKIWKAKEDELLIERVEEREQLHKLVDGEGPPRPLDPRI